MTEQLKPCPFCGEEKQGIGYIGQPATHWFVICGGCGARGGVIDARVTPAGTTEFKTTEQIESAWNRRAEVPS